MALRDRLRRLEKTMRGQLAYFELADGGRFYFDRDEKAKATFLYFAKSMDADYHRVPRPEPPEVLRAVGDAKDRREALFRVMGDARLLPIDREALIERGEFVPRSLLAGKTYEDLGIPEDLSE